MAIELPSLPYSRDALVPYISKETIDYHYGKHHQAYVTKVNQMIEGTDLQNSSLEEIMLNSSGALFNNAAQAWNHVIYWNSLKPGGSGEPNGDLARSINNDFGSFSNFRDQFTAVALGQFGSGWAWLVVNAEKKLQVLNSANANNPYAESRATVLLGCDVWEHAYYIDTRNDRATYVKNFFELINWDFASKNFASQG